MQYYLPGWRPHKALSRCVPAHALLNEGRDELRILLDLGPNPRMPVEGIGQIGEKVVDRLKPGGEEGHARDDHLFLLHAKSLLLRHQHSGHQIVLRLLIPLLGQHVKIFTQLAHCYHLLRFLALLGLFAEKEIIQPLAQPDELCFRHPEHSAQDDGVVRGRDVGGELNRPFFPGLGAAPLGQGPDGRLEFGDHARSEGFVHQLAEKRVPGRVYRPQGLAHPGRDVVNQVAAPLRGPCLPIAKGGGAIVVTGQHPYVLGFGIVGGVFVAHPPVSGVRVISRNQKKFIIKSHNSSPS